jgi:creatinine amidohydrolase
MDPAGTTYDDSRLHFAHLTYADLETLLTTQRAPVLLLPVGSTEPHGPHSPLATDPIISMGMCLRAARRLHDDPEIRPLILPPVAYAPTRYTGAWPGAVHVSEDTLHALLVDVLTSLGEQGFKHTVIVNNHFEPEHVQTLHRAIDTVRDRTGVLTGYLDLTRGYRARELTAEFREGGSHAGRYETSLVLADHPELIDREVLGTLEEVPVNLAEMLAAGHKDFTEIGMDRAYNGSPARATAEEGRESFEVLTDMLVEQMRALVRGTGGRDESGLYGRV